MEELRLGDQLIRYDRNATVAGYSKMDRGSAESCRCIFCRNYIPQREQAYPPDFVRLLDQLGIDSTKEGDLYEAGPPLDKVQAYGGWFYFVGEVVEAGERLANMSKDFGCFVRGAGQTSATRLFGEDVCALEFSAKVPWILEENAE
jgi:hypothetical protein